MSASDHHGSNDERFERLLIDSARGDELPSNVDAAWDRFGAALNAAGGLAVGAAGAIAARRAQRWLAAKWLIWGALTGSALTALSLRPSHEPHALQSAAAPAVIAVPAVANSARAAGIELEARHIPGTPPGTTKPKLRSAPARTFAASPSHGEAPAPPHSTLAAQVSLLDTARSALAAGAYAEALSLAERYRTEFPNGELAPEAEVVAIEALVEQGERQPALERAARFLARYPGDPHSARVKWLVR